MSAKPAVLFVCLGNICRSPLAEAAFRREASLAGLDVEVELGRDRPLAHGRSAR